MRWSASKTVRPCDWGLGPGGRCLSLLLVVGLLLLGCGAPGENTSPLIIGVIADRDANLGRDTLEATQLAIEQMMAQGGLQRPEGTRSVSLRTAVVATPEEALGAAREMTLAGIDALVGPSFSRHAIPVATVADFAQLPMVSPKSTHPDTTLGKSFAFRVAFTDDFQGLVLARFADEHLGARQVGILYDASGDYNRSIARVFSTELTARGATVHEEIYAPGVEDYRPILERLLAHEPELLFLPNYRNDIVVQAQQARELGFEGTLLGGDGWAPGTLDDPALVGAYFCQHWFAPSDDEARSREFVEAFQNRFGRQPNDLAALSYDALGLLLEALATAPRLEAQSVRDQLAKTADFAGVTGTIGFPGSDGDPSKPALILQVGPDDTRTVFHRSPAEAPAMDDAATGPEEGQ